MGQLFSSNARSRRFENSVHGTKTVTSAKAKQGCVADKNVAPVSRLSGPSADLLLYAELGIQNAEPVVGVLSLVDASTVLQGKATVREGGEEGKRNLFRLSHLGKGTARRGSRKKSYWRNPNFSGDSALDPNDFGAFVDEDQGLPWQTTINRFGRNQHNKSCAGGMDEKERNWRDGQLDPKWNDKFRRSSNLAVHDPERNRDPDIPGAISIESESTRSMETCDISQSSYNPSTSSPPSSPVPDSTKHGIMRAQPFNQSIARQEQHLEKVVVTSDSFSPPPLASLQRGSSAGTKESRSSAGNNSFNSKESSRSNHTFGSWSSSGGSGMSRKIRIEPALALFGRGKRSMESPYASLDAALNAEEDLAAAHFSKNPSHHLNYSVLESIDENASIDEERKSAEAGEDDSLMNFSHCVFGEEENKGGPQETSERLGLGSVAEEEKRSSWEYDEDEVSLSLSRCTESQIGIHPKEVARTRSKDSLHLQFDVGSGRVLAVDSDGGDSFGTWSLSVASQR